MKRRVSSLFVTLIALSATGCMPPYGHTGEHVGTGGAAPADTTVSTNVTNCNAQAGKKLSLFDRPDTYPISDAEKHNAYQALYDECMKGYETGVRGPKPDFDVAAASTGGNLAALSPAAGGPPKTNGVTVANGVTVIDTAQIANLSPAAGGNALAGTGISGISTGTGPNGSTVVVVQASPSTTTLNPVIMQPVPTHAAAIPVTPAAAEPKQLVENTAPQPAEKPKKTARAKAHKSTTQTAANTDPSDKRSRFEKNAVPVSGLNNLQPSAGSLVDSAVTTNLPPQKY